MKVMDRALSREWIAVLQSAALKEEPVQTIVMGERLVLFRSGGGIRAFKDLCIHRGAALSQGCVKDGRLVCPYHAWEYDADGACAKIPQLAEGQAIPSKARAFKYACTEKYGLIWVNLEGNEPPLFDMPEWENPGVRQVPWGPQQVAAKPPRVIENFLDVGHLAVVHEGYLGAAAHTEIGDYRVRREADSIKSDEIAIYQPDPDGTGRGREMYYTYEILRPLTVKFTKLDREIGRTMTMLMTVQPVSDTLSVAYGLMTFNYELNLDDDEINRFQDMIFAQDKPVVEHQKPEDLPLDLQLELSLKCDRMSIAYRQYLRESGVVFGTA